MHECSARLSPRKSMGKMPSARIFVLLAFAVYTKRPGHAVLKSEAVHNRTLIQTQKQYFVHSYSYTRSTQCCVHTQKRA